MTLQFLRRIINCIQEISHIIWNNILSLLILYCSLNIITQTYKQIIDNEIFLLKREIVIMKQEISHCKMIFLKKIINIKQNNRDKLPSNNYLLKKNNKNL